MLALVLALSLSADPAPECKADTDCVLRLGCGCECCREEKPMTKAAAEEDRKRCMALGPCGDPRCDKVECAKPVPGVAVCREGRCAKLPKGR